MDPLVILGIKATLGFYLVLGATVLIVQRWGDRTFQLVRTIVLCGTLVFVALQARESNRSANFQKYTIEIQNQPAVVLSDFMYLFVPTAININGKASCYGNKPANNFQRINDFIFYIEVSSSKLKEYNENPNDTQAKTEHYFYLRDIPDVLSEYFEANPNPTKDDLDQYLKTIKDKPIKKTHKAGSGFVSELAFGNYYILKDIDEWRKLSTVFPPNTAKPLNTTRVMGDLMPRIKKGHIILIYFCSTRYEGSTKGSESTSHYVGTIYKSPFDENMGKVSPEKLPERLKNVDVYPFTEVKTWVSGMPIPE